MQNIPENWRDSAASIIETGRILNQQRENLSVEEYTKWLAQQPLGTISTAQKLAKIARHPILGDAAYTSKLPPNWGKLYEASFLPEVYLKDKIANGGIESITRFDIYRLRNRGGRPGKPAKTAAHKRIRRNNPVVVPPEYKCLSDWIRIGIKLEERAGVYPNTACLKIGMKKDTYNRGRDVVLLFDRDDLSPDDRRIVVDAMAEMDSQRTVFLPHKQVAPIWTKILGSDARGRRMIRLSDERRRKEDFARAITVVYDTCLSAVDINIPFMAEKESEAAVSRLFEATQALSELVKNIRRAAND